MLDLQLSKAGFFEISGTLEQPEPGVTYVRPRPAEVIRVFVPAGTGEVEVYAGSLRAGQLVFRGPAEQALSLPLLSPQPN